MAKFAEKGTRRSIEDLYDAIFAIRETLQDAMQLASEAVNIADSFGGEISRVITAQLNQYFIPILAKYLDDENTPGAIAPLVAFLDSVPLAMTRQPAEPQQTAPAPIKTELAIPPSPAPAEGSYAAKTQQTQESKKSAAKKLTENQSTSDENTLIRAYNAINQITAEDVKKIIKDKFSSKTTLDLVAGILASNHPTDIENPDYLKCLHVFCAEGLVTIPEDGAVIDYSKAAREKAVALAAKYSIDPDIALKVVDFLISKLLNLTFVQNTVSVGKGEILFALIIKNAAKRNVGDLSVGNLHFELKGRGARLSGSGAQGGLLAKPTYIASLIKKYIVENFSDIPLKYLKEPTSLNVYATGPLLLVELAHALTNNPDRLRDMATQVTDIICSLVSKPSRHQELQQQMIQAILNQDWYLFRNLLLAYHFESYKERANWDSLLMFNSDENVIARFDSSSSFIEAVKNGYIHVIPFSFSPGRREIGAEREAGFQITLQVYHKASEPIPRILKQEKKQELKKQKLLDTIATSKATLQAKTAQIQNNKLTPSKRNAINKSIQSLNIRIQKLEQQIRAL